jgi:hypothetical protein
MSENFTAEMEIRKMDTLSPVEDAGCPGFSRLIAILSSSSSWSASGRFARFR